MTIELIGKNKAIVFYQSLNFTDNNYGFYKWLNRMVLKPEGFLISKPFSA